MKANFYFCIVQKTLTYLLVAAVLLACSTANAFQNQIYFEGFDGGTGAPLHSTTDDFASEPWIANGFATDNGVLNVSPDNFEGAATLPLTLVADTTYTVEMDVTSNAAEWVGIGFSENPPATNDDGTIMNPNRQQDRFAQSGGRAWMLIRPGEVGPTALGMQVEVFGGGNMPGSGTANVITDSNTDFSGPTAVTRTLTVVLTTASTGFTADFLIDGVSQTMGPQPLFEDSAATIPLTDLTLIDNVGFTWEGQSPGGVAGAITVDNFCVSDDRNPVLLGDVNTDETVDFGDIAPFINLLSNFGFSEEADINGDGVVNFSDIAPFIGILSGQ